MINCQPHDVPILIAVRLLKPLGNPPPNSVKFFAASNVLELAKDRAWLAKVTNAFKGSGRGNWHIVAPQLEDGIAPRNRLCFETR